MKRRAGRTVRRRTAPAGAKALRPRSAEVRAAAAQRPAAAPTFPLRRTPDVLRSVIALSRGVNFEGQDADLLALFYDTLVELLPGRLIAVRSIDATTSAPGPARANGRLRDEAAAVVLRRAALRRTRLADVSGPGVTVEDEPPLVFVDAGAGFSVPLVAGGNLVGLACVEYAGRPAGLASAPLAADESLVIPLANHIAVALHMRRVLREAAGLRESLEQLIDHAHVLIVATDRSGRATIWNRAIVELTGLRRSEVLGQPLATWAAELGAPDLGQAFADVLASSKAVAREVRLPSRGGMVLRAVFNVALVRGRGEAEVTILGIGQDVTALRSLQSQVIHAEKLATVGQIAAGVAHEINNPLTSIQVCAEALMRKASREGASFDAADLDRARKIVEGAERIGRFARDLVTYARPSGAEAEALALNDVVAQALSFCEHVLEESHADVERDLAADLPAVQGVRDQILQVLINLVTNAAHALARGGHVRVRTWAGGDGTVSLAVSDDGAGIPEPDRAHVFEPFFSTKPAGQGTGLGLSIVRNIVYAHGGHVSFRTREGVGTTFVVAFPVRRDGFPLKSEPPSAQS